MGPSRCIAGFALSVALALGSQGSPAQEKAFGPFSLGAPFVEAAKALGFQCFDANTKGTVCLAQTDELPQAARTIGGIPTRGARSLAGHGDVLGEIMFFFDASEFGKVESWIKANFTTGSTTCRTGPQDHRCLYLDGQNFIFFAEQPEPMAAAQTHAYRQTTEALMRSAGAVASLPAVEGWRRGSVTTYADAALGQSVSYDSPHGRVTVFVYGGHAAPRKITVPELAREFEKASSDIVELGRRGDYRNLVELQKLDLVSLGGANGKAKAFRRTFGFTDGEREKESALYLLVREDKFIKIRVTRDRDIFGETAAAHVLQALDGHFAR